MDFFFLKMYTEKWKSTSQTDFIYTEQIANFTIYMEQIAKSQLLKSEQVKQFW